MASLRVIAAHHHYNAFMKLIKVGAAVLNQTPLDWPNNKANILTAIEAARAENVSVLCLPELSLTGYGCEDMFASAGMRRTAREVLFEIAPHVRDMLVTIGLPVMHRGALFNAQAIVVNGEVVGFVAKQNLAGDGLHYEPRWFKPWPADVRDEVQLDGRAYPIGETCIDLGGVRIGFEICEDAWVANRPGRDMAEQAIDIILNPSASHFAFDKFEVRKRFVLEGSRAFGVTYVYSNLIGNEAGRAIYDGGAIIASNGRMTARGPRFTFKNMHLTTAVVDVDVTRQARAKLVSFAPAIVERAGSMIARPFDWPDQSPQTEAPAIAPWDVQDATQEEEFTRAIALGLFDYMRKSRSHGYVVSLSGGADSAAVACLVRVMIELAIDELTVEEVKRKLGYIKLAGNDREAIAGRLLTTAYQSTKNSSDTTRHAARAVAEGAGAQHLEFDVDALVNGFVAMVGDGLGRELTWQTDDIALQNIQARVRAPGVWMLANIEGKLLASTSNRSEAAVGYATMDGDTSGGISPIAGIDKAFLRQWLRWMETQGPRGLGPIPALAAVNAQQPTAELRPLDSKQTDEGDLMPYDLLDEIENAAIGDKQTPIEVYQRVRGPFKQYDDAQLVAWIEKFFRLWSRNQWKRERYAPSFHVDDKNLDPKTWCRFPILSGGFEREMGELREQANVKR